MQSFILRKLVEKQYMKGIRQKAGPQLTEAIAAAYQALLREQQHWAVDRP
jgi:hypothetical protein